MRVDEGSSWSLLAIDMKARTVLGRGEKSLVSDPGFELRHIGEGEGERKVR